MTTPSAPDPFAVPDPFAAPEPARGAESHGADGQVPSSPAAPPTYPAYPSALPGYPTTPGQPATAGAQASWSGAGTQANNLAVWALVLAVLGWVCLGLLTSIPAIVVGGRAKRAAAEGRANNPGMATAGIVLGWIATVLNALGLVVFAVLVATRGWDGLVDLVEQYGTVTTP